MSIIKVITNFKESLLLNYYSRDSEKEEFLRWLQLNIDYDNGVVKIAEKKIITESEQKSSVTGFDDLKNLVKTWAYSKHVKQDYWNDLLVKNLDYINGVLYFDDE